MENKGFKKKRENIIYMTGHVRIGIANRFDDNISIINQVKNWQGTGKPFEYYRRSFGDDGVSSSVNNPPLEITI